MIEGERRYIPVLINDQYFDSYGEAARALNVTNVTIRNRCLSDSFPEYEHTEYRIPEYKKCSICSILKSKNDFNKYHKVKSGLNSCCKECHRDFKLRRKFNITTEDYNNMFVEQKGKCLICNKHQSELDKRLAIDHNHETGVVRGLLCCKCNTGIGMLSDDIGIVRKAVEYLEKYN